MKKLLAGIAVATACVVGTLPAKAAVLFDFSFTSLTVAFSGQLAAVPDGGDYDVTGITGSVSSLGVGTFAITGLVAAGGTPPATGTTPDGLFFYNDVVFTGPPLHFDLNGV